MLYSKRVDSERMSSEIIMLKDRIPRYQETVKRLQDSLRNTEKARTMQRESYESAIVEKDAMIKELKNELVHATAVAERNGANTGIDMTVSKLLDFPEMNESAFEDE